MNFFPESLNKPPNWKVKFTVMTQNKCTSISRVPGRNIMSYNKMTCYLERYPNAIFRVTYHRDIILLPLSDNLGKYIFSS